MHFLQELKLIMDKCGFSDCGKEEATGFGYKVWYSTTQNPLKQPKKTPNHTVPLGQDMNM